MQYASDRSPSLESRVSDDGTRLFSRKRNSFAKYILILRAYSGLIHCDRYLVRGDFATLYQTVRGEFP